MIVQGKQKSSKWSIIIPTIILIACTAIFATLLMAGKNKLIIPTEQYKAPGSYEVRIDTPGSYTIFLQNQTTFEGKEYAVEEDFAGLKCEITYKGKSIVVEDTSLGYSYEDSKGQKGQSYFEFQAKEAGKYLLKTEVEGRKEPVIIAIDKTNEKAIYAMTNVMLGFTLFCIGIVQFLGVFFFKFMIYLLDKKNLGK